MHEKRSRKNSRGTFVIVSVIHLATPHYQLFQNDLRNSLITLQNMRTIPLNLLSENPFCSSFSC